jgi:hypothetical protein
MSAECVWIRHTGVARHFLERGVTSDGGNSFSKDGGPQPSAKTVQHASVGETGGSNRISHHVPAASR